MEQIMYLLRQGTYSKGPSKPLKVSHSVEALVNHVEELVGKDNIQAMDSSVADDGPMNIHLTFMFSVNGQLIDMFFVDPIDVI